MRYFISTLLFIVSTIPLYAQQLLPFVENFTKSEYAGDNQVWSVVQGTDDGMYFANNHYLLRYNGVKWEKYMLPNKTIIRSVFADGSRLYCGSYKEFGFWERVQGKMRYKSLSAKFNFFTGISENEEIWKIFKFNGKIYFQSFNELYVAEGEKINKIRLPFQISYCYPVDNTLYVASVKNGLYSLEGNKFIHLDNWKQLNNNIIHGVGSHNGQVYVFTKNNGIYSGSSNKLSPWANPLNTILKSNVILSAQFINNNILAIGTALEGLYIVDMQSGTYRNINRKNLLKNNAVLSIASDKENDIWMGLDNGIAHVEVNSPISIFTDNSGLLGSVYSILASPKGYLLASNHGLFNLQNSILSSIPNSQGQAWDIYNNNGSFIIGHNDGTFVYKNNGFYRVNPVNGGWKLFKSDVDNVYFQANYSGIVVYPDINDLTKWKVLPGITRPVRHLEQNRKGELWAADNYRGLYRILYSDDFKTTKVENITIKNKITKDFGVRIFKFRNELLFYINNIWYNYNAIENKLQEHILFNQHFKRISDIVPISDEKFAVLKQGILYIVTQDRQNFRWELLPEKYYQGKLIMDNTHVYARAKKLMVNLDDGFLTIGDVERKPILPNINVEAFYEGQLVDNETDIAYNQPLELNIISDYFGYNRPNLLYRINGSELLPVTNGSILLNNLSSGTQILEVFLNDGNATKPIATYKFSVERPWYFSMSMIILYVLTISGIFFLYYRWNKLRYNQKLKLKEEELNHHKKILELEMEAENKLRQREHEKQMLEMEVQSKASEVAGKSLSIAKHSEMIEDIQEVLESDLSGEQLKNRLKKIVKANSMSKHEWQSFEKNLVKSHEEFVNRLSKKYPSLTPKDIKLCIYLKMNLSSKEIAPLMNISFRGVELHRYRLRKKIGITQEENLSRFMINL